MKELEMLLHMLIANGLQPWQVLALGILFILFVWWACKGKAL